MDRQQREAWALFVAAMAVSLAFLVFVNTYRY